MNSPHDRSQTLSVDVGHVETGLWCQRHLKPSGYRANLLSLGPSGVSVIGTISRCDDGDHPLRLTGDL